MDDLTPEQKQVPPEGFDLSAEASRQQEASILGVSRREGDLIAEAEEVPDNDVDDADGAAADDDD